METDLANKSWQTVQYTMWRKRPLKLLFGWRGEKIPALDVFVKETWKVKTFTYTFSKAVCCWSFDLFFHELFLQDEVVPEIPTLVRRQNSTHCKCQISAALPTLFFTVWDLAKLDVLRRTADRVQRWHDTQSFPITECPHWKSFRGLPLTSVFCGRQSEACASETFSAQGTYIWGLSWLKWMG